MDYLKAVGFAATQSQKNLRSRINNKVKTFIYELADYVNIDSAADQLGVKFLYDALPPVLTEGKIYSQDLHVYLEFMIPYNIISLNAYSEF